jgi:hypothetical protein
MPDARMHAADGVWGVRDDPAPSPLLKHLDDLRSPLKAMA